MKGGGRMRIKKEDGQSMVEFALILPLLILLLCGILDFGWIFGNQLTLNNAGREAARYTAINYDEAQAPTSTYNFNLADSVLRNRASLMNNANLVVTLTRNGSAITVSATYPLPILTPVLSTILGDDVFQLDAATTMRLE
jgi:Flp pilus assembly protein TadG